VLQGCRGTPSAGRRVRPRAVAVITALGAALLLAASSTAAGKPRTVIIFDRHIGSTSDYDIFSIRPDASHENLLVDTDYDDWGAAASPDGRLLAFASQRDSDGNDEIFVSRPDGSHPHQLTHTGPNTYNEWPAFTPDGERILFDSDRKNGVGQIFVMRVDGSHQHALTKGGKGRFDAVMSPNGKQIAFSRFVGPSSNLDVFRMRADGSNEKRLTTDPTRDELPSWFPSSEKLAFESGRDGDDEIFVMRPNGSHVHRLTKNTDTGDQEPAVAANGKRIVFGRATPGNDEDIWVMRADGSGQHPVTDNAQTEEYPDWAKLR
jgi:Tol biopolymer transport system component